MSTEETAASSPTPAPKPPITGDLCANPDKKWRLKFTILGILGVGLGIYCAIDGWYRYPKQNAEAFKVDSGAKVPNSPLSLFLNRMLAIVLPAAGITAYAYNVYRARGQVKMIGDTIHIPGHPPIPLDSITALESAKWDRKGIAKVTYESGGSSHVFTLDDFIYERPHIDAIYDRIKAHLTGPVPESAPVDSEPNP